MNFLFKKSIYPYFFIKLRPYVQTLFNYLYINLLQVDVTFKILDVWTYGRNFSIWTYVDVTNYWISPIYLFEIEGFI
jgi:hypothetical protein